MNGIEQPVDRFPADLTARYEVSVLANYRGEEYRVTAICPSGMATLGQIDDRFWALRAGYAATTLDRSEKQAHVGTLYNYREIQRNLLFDRWLAEHATGQRP